MKTSRIRVSAVNRIIISLLFIILLAVAYADITRRRRTKELTASITMLSGWNRNITMLQQSISDLYEAENNFRLYAATYDKSYFYEYCDGLKRVQIAMDSLQRNYKGPVDGLKDAVSLDETFKKKLAINKMIVDLKQVTDSALMVAIQLDSSKGDSLQPSHYKIPITKIGQRDTTITEQKEAKRTGFFQRIKKIFSDTNDRDTITIKQLSASSIEHDSAVIMINNAIRSVEDYYRNYLKAQAAARNMLNSKDRELVLLNFSLIERLNQMLHSFQVLEQNDQDMNKKRALKIANYSAGQLSLVTTFSFLVIILLLLLVLYNIYQVNNHAAKLLVARLEAEKQTKVKSNLMASVSHEIRNPLTVIRGFAELLYNSDLSGTQQEQLKAVKGASDLLLSTVNDILDFSKLEAGRMSIQPVAFQPAKLLGEVQSIMRSLAEQKGLKLLVETTGLTPDLTVRGDAFRLKQVLINLVSNAIKFTNQGEITIKTFNTVISDGSIRPERRPVVKRTYLHFEVTDTGIGIPANKIKNVFEEFEQIKQSSGSPVGTGLGLAICKRVVSLHGGSINASSEIGKGSVFSVRVNVETVSAANTETPAYIVSPAPSDRGSKVSGMLKNKNILLVDDNPLIIQLALILLRKQGATVTTAEDGTLAWNLFSDQYFDMVITDINLPGISGISIARNIRNSPDPKKMNVPILALTGDILEQDIENYNTAGINGYIIKPFGERDFLIKIEKCL